MGDKAVFESRDLSQTFIEKRTGGDKKFLGVERRRGARRSGRDRREAVRFEDGSTSCRRENPGRRSDDNSLNFW